MGLVCVHVCVRAHAREGESAHVSLRKNSPLSDSRLKILRFFPLAMVIMLDQSKLRR